MKSDALIRYMFFFFFLNDSDVTTRVNSVASSSSWSPICNLQTGVTKIRGSPQDYCLHSKVNTVNGCGQANPPKGDSHMVDCKSGSARYPTMIRWTISGRVHRKSSARNVTHPRTIPTLGGLNSQFYGIQVKALLLSQPFQFDNTP